MTRFFIDSSRVSSTHVTLDARDSHHLVAVLKKRSGDKILVCDDTGNEYLVLLESVTKQEVIGKIVDFYHLATEPSTEITVAQALPKTLEKLERVFQHGTELGAKRYIPFYSARSREDWQRLVPKRERWQEIVRTAAEQSRRAICPIVEQITGFSDVVASSGSYDLALFANENEHETPLKATLEHSKPKSILIIVGPEGGFADNEVVLAKESTAKSISLGPRILRTETAALCVISQILYALETT